jgi:hypothetical protein
LQILQETTGKVLLKHFKDGYLMGFFATWVEALNIAESYRSRHPEETLPARPPLEHWAKCITTKEMPYRQLRAIVEKYLDENPNKWDSSMARLTWLAMMSKCRD